MIWWDLPGPRAFIEAVVEDVRQGKSVFLRLPEHCPKRLSGALRDVLGQDLRWFSTSADTSLAPINFLYDLLVSRSDPAILRSPRTLVNEAEFQGHLVWLEELSSTTWPAWSEFFLEYERASRSVHPARKTHFLIPLVKANWNDKFPGAIGIGQFAWDGWVRYGDMLHYSCVHIGERATPLETRLTISMVAELAAWDPELCEWLARFSIDGLSRPTECLTAFAKTRGWSSDTLRTSANGWSTGLSQTVNGRSVSHPCLLSPAELERVIWRAEIAVLMPFIEECRQDLLSRHAKRLKVPFTSSRGERIESLLDLEIGHIEWQLAARGGVKHEEMEWVSTLKQARNSLSHLEPVEMRVLAAILMRSDDSSS
jgi:hypothetical protein